MVAFALGYPGFGPRRIAAELARPQWGGVVLSANGVWLILRRHGLSRRERRLALVAGAAAPPGPERPEPQPERHLDAKHPGNVVQFDCFTVGRLSGTEGPAGRPQSNGAVERVQRTILEECWGRSFARSLVPKLTALQHDIESNLRSDTAHVPVEEEAHHHRGMIRRAAALCTVAGVEGA